MPEGMQVTAFSDVTAPGPIRHYMQADLYFVDGSQQEHVHSCPLQRRRRHPWPHFGVLAGGLFRHRPLTELQSAGKDMNTGTMERI